MSDNLLARVEALIRQARIPVEHDLWDRATIAAYLKCSDAQVSRIIVQPEFPRPIRIPTADGRRMHPRWLARAVVAWAESHAKAA